MRSLSRFLSVLALAPSTLLAATPPAEFSLADRTLFAEYRALERERIPIFLASVPERTAKIAAELQRRGGQVIGRRDELGYLYVWMPMDAVQSMPHIEGVQALQVASSMVRSTASPDDEPESTTPSDAPLRRPGPTPATPVDNPFTGEAATQALAFKTNHPNFDGRGVVTAIVEPAAPNMSTMRGALDLSGKPVPKIPRYDLGSQVDAVASTADNVAVWQETEAVKANEQGSFTWLEQSYRLPADIERSSTRWRIVRRLPSPFLTDQEQYDILWAVDKQKVWVLPKSQGNDFSKARSAVLTDAVPWVALGDEKSRRMSPTSAHAFVFAVDRKRLWLASAVTMSGHAGMVGSVMVGAGFLGGRANGIAPAAQLAIFHGGRTLDAPAYGPIQQQLAMVSDPDVDIAQASYALSDTARFGGVSPHQFWIDRLIRKNGKIFVKAHGNYGAIWFGSDEFSNADEVFAVGAYTPRETWRANLGVTPAAEHTIVPYSGWGPADDGGLVPDFLGLTQTLSEGTGHKWYWEGMEGFEQYSASGGTSAGAPNGAGHLALLVSAAKQTGVPHDAARMRAAVATTAQFLKGVEARAQGHGLIQVSDAWTALQRAAKWQPASFKVQAPLVGAEPTANGAVRLTGRGLFEISGWRPGQTGKRELTVTRTAGRTQENRYRLRWKGDVEVFSSTQHEIELPLGKPVVIPVDIRAGSASGSQSAILDLIDPHVELVAGSVLCTVMVSDPLPTDGTALRYQRQAARLGITLFVVDVPPGLSAITVQLNKDDTVGYWFAQDSTGRKLPFNLYGSDIHSRPNPTAEKARSRTITYPNPAPGVWQFGMQMGEPRSVEVLQSVKDWSQPMPLDVQIQGWAADDASIASASREAVQVQFKDPAQSLKTNIESIGLGAARSHEVKLEPGLHPTLFDVVVDPGATLLEVQFEQLATRARVGLYVYKIPTGERLEKTTNGTSDNTALVYYDSSIKPNKRYALKDPPAGNYRIALDLIDAPSSEVTVAYRDTVYHPVYGTLELNPESSPSSGAKSVLTKVTVRAHPADDRQLTAKVGLFPRGSENASPIATRAWIVPPTWPDP